MAEIRISLKRRIQLMVLSVCTVIFISGISGGYYWIRSWRNDLDQRGHVLVGRFALIMNLVADKNKSYARSMRDSFEMSMEARSDDFFKNLRSRLQILQNNSGGNTVNIFVVRDSDGSVYDAMGFYGDWKFDLKGLDWYDEGIKSENLLSLPPYLDPKTQKFVYNVVIPVKTPSGRLLGLGGATYPVDSVVDIMLRQASASDGVSFCIDKKGNLWSQIPGAEEILVDIDPKGGYNMRHNILSADNVISESMVKAGALMLSGKPGTAEAVMNGQRYQLFFAPTEDEFIAVRAVSLEGLIIAQARIWGYILLAIVVVVIIALAMSRRLLQELGDLSGSIQSIEHSVETSFNDSGDYINGIESAKTSFIMLVDEMRSIEEKTAFSEFCVIFRSLSRALQVIQEQNEINASHMETIITTYMELDGLHAEVRASYQYLMAKFQEVAGVHHLETVPHLERVSKYCGLAARWLGWPDDKVDDIILFSKVHDMGKIRVPLEILNKPSRLTDAERTIIEKHTIWGAELVGDAKWLQMAHDICLYHHERWDGTGYPFRMRGSSIPVSAQIVAIMDIYDALRSERSYKPGYSHTEAMSIILSGDGRTSPSHFSPTMLEFISENSAAIEDIFKDTKSA